MVRRAASPKSPRVEFDHPAVLDPATLKFRKASRPTGDDEGVYERDPITGDSSSYRRRTRHSEPLDFADEVVMLAVFTCDAVHDFGALIDATFAHSTGRPRAHPRFVHVALDAIASLTGRSIRYIYRQLRHDPRWAEIRDLVAAACGTTLPTKPPTADQHAYFVRNHIKDVPELLAEYDALLERLSIDIARLIGCGASEQRTTSIPDPSNVLYGDATWVHTKFKIEAHDERARRVDPATGEITMRRVDPDARPYHGPDRGGGVGGYWSIAQMTNGEAHERVILHMCPLDRNDKDGDHCADTAIHLKAAGLSIHGLGYDMALDTASAERLQIHGILPISKVRRDRSGAPAHRIIPHQTFQLTDGTHRTLDVHAIDGTPYISGFVDGTEHFFRLDYTKHEPRRSRNESQPDSGRASAIYRVPDQPGVATVLRNATVRIRTTSTDDEIARGERRGRALRPISQAHPEFRALYGPREGVESTNAHWKHRLPGRRQRSVGRTAQRFNANGYQLAQNLKAALAWHLRTGGDLSCIWRNGIPPGILPEPVALAA